MPGKTVEELRKRLIGKARKQVQEKYTGKEGHIIRAAAIMQDLDASFNLLAEHCIEWHGMHFPELQKLIRDNVVQLKLIHLVGNREKFTEKAVEEHAGEKTEKVIAAAKKSMGSPIDAASLKEVQLLARNALNLREERDVLLKFIEKEAKELVPNLTELAGALLAARLLGEAGSLKRLALLPSSTVQLLGAEKALFRHLKNRQAKPPKHGFILMHQLVQKAPRGMRGKMARALAGKLSIAARADYFGKRKIAEKLQKDLDKRFKELKK